ncbi:MAG: 1-acyl-sn-glycerol-3-phosphate acyltransferase [Clostridia bacterium]|nr:1-acyl-sn-glycerol-3-phosphate acyltransferase [Clostridia bacterium]
MKFLCPLSPKEIIDTIDDHIFEYNVSRRKRHLRIKKLECTESTLRIREGKKGRLGVVAFDGTMQESPDGTVISGTVKRIPTPAPKDRLVDFLLKAVVIIPLIAALYGAFLGLSLLFGGDSYLTPIIVPSFIFLLSFGSYLLDVSMIRRRAARFMVAYLGATELQDAPALVRKKKRNTKKLVRMRHILVYHILRPLVRIFLRLYIGFKGKKPIKTKNNFIMRANHVTDFDMLFMGVSVKPQMYFVMSEHMLRKGFVSKLLIWAFDPIPRAKASNAGATVMDILRHCRAGHNVAFFAEGFRTMSGYNQGFSPATGAMVKKAGCDLITYRIKGGFYANPNWGTGLRKGKIWGDIVRIYSAEELSKMTVDEVNEAIYRDTYEDASVTQSQYRIPYKLKKGKGGLAEHLEYALLVCPKCRRMASIHSEGDRFWCDCGLEGRYNEYGDLVGEALPYHTVSDWFRFQSEFIDTMPDEGEEKVLLSAQNQSLIEIDDFHHANTVIVEGGEFKQTSKGFSVDNVFFAYEDIAYFDIIRHGYLLFTTTDKRYYEIESHTRFPGMLSKMLYQRFGNKTK